MRPMLLLCWLALLLSPASPLSAKSYSPWVVSEQVADLSGNWHWFMRHPAFRGKRDHELAVALWKYFCSRETGMVHTGSWDEPTTRVAADGSPDIWGNSFTYKTIYDPVRNLNSLAMGYCGMQSTVMAGIFRALGYPARTVNLNHGYSHQICEVFYEGGWHFIDTDERGVVLTPGGELASWDQMAAHPEWWPHRPFPDAPHFPQHLKHFGGLVRQGKVQANARKWRWEPLGHTMDFELRMGESLTRWWRADSTRYYAGWWDRPDGAGDWLRRTVAAHPEHIFTHQQRGEYGSIYDRPGMGHFSYRPRLGQGWQDYADGFFEQENVAQDQRGVTAGPGGGWTSFKLWTPYLIIGRNGDRLGERPPREGAVVEYSGRGKIAVSISLDFGGSWERVHTGERGRLDLTERLYGRWGYLLRFELPEGARLEELALDTWVQVAPVSLPAVKGETIMHFRTGDRTGRRTAVLPLEADLSLSTDSLARIGWLELAGPHDRWSLRERAPGARVLVRPPRDGSLSWLTLGGAFLNEARPELWLSTTGAPDSLRFFHRLEAPDWANHWMSAMDEYFGAPDSIPGALLVEYRRNVNNIRIYAHYEEPARPVRDSPVEITHCIGGQQTSLVARADTSYTVRGEGANEWIRLRVASHPAPAAP